MVLESLCEIDQPPTVDYTASHSLVLVIKQAMCWHVQACRHCENLVYVCHSAGFAQVPVRTRARRQAKKMSAAQSPMQLTGGAPLDAA